MPAVHLDSVSFRYSSASDLIADATFHLGPGWTGVVGANGSGKTTLLRLVEGSLIPSTGSVTLDPADAVVTFCEQEVEALSDEIAAFGASWDGPDTRLRGRLGLEPTQLDRWSSLSPGERKRWQVAAALASQPDVLLLDEPTNHLDAAGRDWLFDALRRFGGVGLAVSHDRLLLERLTTQTLRVHDGGVEVWSGPYETARSAWTAAANERVAAYQRLRRERKKLDRRIADQRRAAETKRAAYRRRVRTADFKDIDARSTVTQGHFRQGEAAAAHQLGTVVSARDRVAAQAADITIDKEPGGSLYVGYEPSPKADIAALHGDLIAGDRVVVAGVAAVVRRSDRIWLRGRNGAGKTTLLEALRAAASVPTDKVLYLPQELTASQAAELLGVLESLPPDEKGRVLSVVAALGVDPARLLVTDRPSPGEARKLALALGLGTRAWLLLLDEPTNHLDLPSTERLEAALAAYPGAMIVVTHDAALGEALSLEEWMIEDGVLTM